MTEVPVEEVRGVQKCNACSLEDTDPMIHLGYGEYRKSAVLDGETVSIIIPEPSFHHDCLPEEFRAQLVGPEYATVNAIIAAADGGTRGPALQTYIDQLHAEAPTPVDPEPIVEADPPAPVEGA